MSLFASLLIAYNNEHPNIGKPKPFVKIKPRETGLPIVNLKLHVIVTFVTYKVRLKTWQNGT